MLGKTVLKKGKHGCKGAHLGAAGRPEKVGAWSGVAVEDSVTPESGYVLEERVMKPDSQASGSMCGLGVRSRASVSGGT